MDWLETVRAQLALDYCLTPAELARGGNCFTVYAPREGRRRFISDDDFFFKAAVFDGRLFCCGREEIIRRCEREYADAAPEWFMDAESLRGLDALLREYGWHIKGAHPYFILDAPTAVPQPDFDAVTLERADIERFRGDARFGNAFAFNQFAPDVLAVEALRGGEILGMAGASADSPLMWQIGIDVLPAGRGRGVGAALVALLGNEVLARGALPYYGTAQSHIASQRVARRAGFAPAFAELWTVKL